MSSFTKTQMRIVQDYYDFNKNKPDNIFFYLNKKDIFKCYALIIGVKNTPYYGGYYLFQIDFSNNYPESSPSVKMLSVDGNVRLNPNLYECGKVCLSILGTWSGPSWTKVMTVRTILLSIQSLLSDCPIKNEPGYEDLEIENFKNIGYNQYLIYHNYNFSIINTLKNILNNKPEVKIKEFKFFKDVILEEFKKNYEEINSELKSYQITIGETLVPRVIYFLKKDNFLDFVDLNTKFDKLIENKKNELKLT